MGNEGITQETVRDILQRMGDLSEKVDDLRVKVGQLTATIQSPGTSAFCLQHTERLKAMDERINAQEARLAKQASMLAYGCGGVAVVAFVIQIAIAFLKK